MRMVDTLSFAFTVGVAALSWGCSDPVPPEPQGVASIGITTLPDNSSGETCAAAHRANLPASGRSGQVLSAGRWDAMLTNGQGGKVECSVKQNGSSYLAEGSVHVPSPATNWGRISIRVNIGEGQTDAVGQLKVNDEQTGDAYESDSCRFSVDPSSGTLAVAQGRIWASVTCDAFRAVNLTGSTCSVEDSYILFQNCAH